VGSLMGGAVAPLRGSLSPSGALGEDPARAILRKALMGGSGLPDVNALLPQINAARQDRERQLASARSIPLPTMSLNSALAAGGKAVGGKMVPAELFYDPIGGIKYGKNIGAIGGHSNHVHVAYTNEAQLLKALAIAQGLGLHVSENPYVDKVDPVHVKDSFHYRIFPGRYRGRRVGKAFDASGAAGLMAKLYRELAAMR
jgi:hypothetical protein